MENVPGLLSSNGGRDLARLLDELGSIGYGWAYRILDARYFGVPQRRRRVFICARRADSELDTRAAAGLALRALWEGSGGDPTPGWPPREITPTRAGAGAAVGSGIAGSLTKRYGKGVNTTCDDGAMVAFPIDDGRPVEKHQNGTGIGEAGAPAYTLDRQQQPAVAHVSPTLTQHNLDSRSPQSEEQQRIVGAIHEATMSVRRLTPVECERLMGWPDNWTAPPGVKAPDSKRYAACGDGIVSWVAYWIGMRIQMTESENE